jgi:hypothetical protein
MDMAHRSPLSRERMAGDDQQKVNALTDYDMLVGRRVKR